MDEFVEEVAERIRGTIQSVAQDVRALPPEEARARLSAALGDDRQILGDQGVRRAVRHLQNPLWPLKHPLEVLRDLRQR